MIEIQRKDGSWIKFYCPEWNYLLAAEQQDIIRKLKEWPTNVIPFEKKTGVQEIPLFDHTAN